MGGVGFTGSNEPGGAVLFGALLGSIHADFVPVEVGAARLQVVTPADVDTLPTQVAARWPSSIPYSPTMPAFWPAASPSLGADSSWSGLAMTQGSLWESGLVLRSRLVPSEGPAVRENAASSATPAIEAAPMLGDTPGETLPAVATNRTAQAQDAPVATVLAQPRLQVIGGRDFRGVSAQEPTAVTPAESPEQPIASVETAQAEVVPVTNTPFQPRLQVIGGRAFRSVASQEPAAVSPGHSPQRSIAPGDVAPRQDAPMAGAVPPPRLQLIGGRVLSTTAAGESTAVSPAPTSQPPVAVSETAPAKEVLLARDTAQREEAIAISSHAPRQKNFSSVASPGISGPNDEGAGAAPTKGELPATGLVHSPAPRRARIVSAPAIHGNLPLSPADGPARLSPTMSTEETQSNPRADLAIPSPVTLAAPVPELPIRFSLRPAGEAPAAPKTPSEAQMGTGESTVAGSSLPASPEAESFSGRMMPLVAGGRPADTGAAEQEAPTGKQPEPVRNQAAIPVTAPAPAPAETDQPTATPVNILTAQPESIRFAPAPSPIAQITPAERLKPLDETMPTEEPESNPRSDLAIPAPAIVTAPVADLALSFSLRPAGEEQPVAPKTPSEAQKGTGESAISGSSRPSSLEVESFSGRIMPLVAGSDHTAGTGEGPASQPKLNTQPSAPLGESKAASMADLSAVSAQQPAVPVAAEREAPKSRQPEATWSQTAPLQATTPAAEAKPASPAQAAAPVATPAPAPAEMPGKSVQVRLGLEDSTIHLRVVERGAELHVAVSASKTEVASALREGLPELVHTLQSGGYQSEFWKSGSIAGSGTAPLEPGQSGTQDDAPSARHREHGGQRQREEREDRWARQIAEPTA